MSISKITPFKCDRCGGREDVQDYHNHDWQRIIRDARSDYESDLCPMCLKSFNTWWKAGEIVAGGCGSRSLEDGVIAGTMYGPKRP